MKTKQDILDLFKKEYRNEMMSQKYNNDMEIKKILSTTSIKTFKILNKYKKTKIVDNNKDIEKIKKSELYLNRKRKKEEIEEKLLNIDNIDFNNKFEIEYEKFKKEYINDLQNEKIENEKWLTNKEKSYKISIQNQLSNKIIERNLKDVNNFKEKIRIIEEELNQLNENKIINYIYNILFSSYKIKENESNKFQKKVIDTLNETKSINNSYKKERITKRDEKNQLKNFKKYGRIYNKSIDTLPVYMQENLKNMPSNKGQIWRGVYFYGHQKKTDENITILFEKKKRRCITYSHQYNTDENGNYLYTLKEKKNKNQKPIQIKQDVYHINPFSKKELSLLDFKVTSNKKIDRKKKQEKKCDEVDDSVKLDDNDIKFILNNVDEYDNLDIEEENGDYPLLQSK